MSQTTVADLIQLYDKGLLTEREVRFTLWLQGLAESAVRPPAGQILGGGDAAGYPKKAGTEDVLRNLEAAIKALEAAWKHIDLSALRPQPGPAMGTAGRPPVPTSSISD